MSNKAFYLIISLALIIRCAPPMENRAEKLKRHLYFLASDSLKGRDFGSLEEKIAAKYLAENFKEIGLTPAGNKEYFQYFSVKQSTNPHEQAKYSTQDTTGIEGVNVLAKIDNTGNDILVIGAHFDHLGMGGNSSLERGISAIHNGADDNASGTVALLDLAEILKKKNLKYDIVFFGISGEEKGLWGSNYWVKNPTFDISQVKAMINMDMIGRLDTARGLAIHGTGTSPFWVDALDKANTSNLKIIKKESGVGPSDHTSFYLQDIPVLHFFTGQHEDYHKPSDDADKINYEGIILISDYIVRMVELLDKQENLAFTKTKDESSSTPRFTVSLGVVPDYLYNGTGMRIDGVTEGKPAAAAGLLKGDIVVQLGDSAVTDMMSYMRALSVFKKGDSAKVVLERNKEPLHLTVSF